MAKIVKANDWFWTQPLPKRMWIACGAAGVVVALF